MKRTRLKPLSKFFFGLLFFTNNYLQLNRLRGHPTPLPGPPRRVMTPHAHNSARRHVTSNAHYQPLQLTTKRTCLKPLVSIVFGGRGVVFNGNKHKSCNVEKYMPPQPGAGASPPGPGISINNRLLIAPLSRL
jgi:hypothetical protein